MKNPKLLPIINYWTEYNKLNSTPAEVLMAAKLRFHSIAFEAEYPILNEKSFFTADFYLPKHGLLIEVDGEIHSQIEIQAKDFVKDMVYKSFGYHVLRIKNSEVEFFNLDFIKKYKPKRISQYQIVKK